MDKKCIEVRRFILTGTPGSGKTSVIKELEKLGHTVIHEAATDLIRIEQMKGIERPWEELKFLDQIMLMQKKRQMSAIADLQFYDRSPFCTYALVKYLSYWKQTTVLPSTLLLEELDRCITQQIYQPRVLFCENLGFIEHTDVRKISYEDALIFEQIHLDVYKEFGFDIMMVPRESVQDRCSFILSKI